MLKNSPVHKSGIRKSRTSRWRATALIFLNLLMIAHIIQWRIMGKTISPIEPSETMHTLQRGAINAGFIFFALAILATLIFGRFVCGWGCHILDYNLSHSENVEIVQSKRIVLLPVQFEVLRAEFEKQDGDLSPLRLFGLA